MFFDIGMHSDMFTPEAFRKAIAVITHVNNVCLSFENGFLGGRSSQETTAGFNLNDDKAANSAVAYDLTGRKTTANAPGIKVINGKKIVIK